MTKTNQQPAAIEENLLTIADHIDRLQCRQDTIVRVLSYLLAKYPSDNVLRDLSRLANDLEEGGPLFDHHVMLLDELRDEVRRLHIAWRSFPEQD